jgi:hypothetical protein
MSGESGLELVLDGLGFGEGPRWHDGRLWYSDFVLHEVAGIDDQGESPARPAASPRP